MESICEKICKLADQKKEKLGITVPSYEETSKPTVFALARIRVDVEIIKIEIP